MRPAPDPRHLLAARVMLAAGDRAGATAALAEPVPATPRARLEALLLRARAAPDQAAGRRLTEQAVHLGVTHGFRRTLVDETALHRHYRALYRTSPSRDIARVVRDLDGQTTVFTAGAVGEGRHVPVHLLTDRELDILRLLTSHLTNREIAGQLDVSLNTVKTHIKSVYRKLGVENRSSAVEHARQLGLIT
jgi:LuxR family maltose regulon positive regulatory protein